MMVRDRVEPTVKYHVGEDTYTNYEEANEAGEITGVELRYLCPYCETPNVEGHTLPIPSDTISDCDGCRRRWNLTPKDDSTRQYGAEKIDDAAEMLDVKRRVRVAGECYSGQSTLPLSIASIVQVIGLLFAMGGSFSLFILVMMALLAFLTANPVTPFIEPTVFAGAAFAFGYSGLKVSEWLANRTIGDIPMKNPPTTSEIFSNMGLFRHGTNRTVEDSYTTIAEETDEQLGTEEDPEKEMEMELE